MIETDGEIAERLAREEMMAKTKKRKRQAEIDEALLTGLLVGQAGDSTIMMEAATDLSGGYGD